MITLQTDIKLSMEDLGVSFNRLLDDHSDELKRISREAVDSYDFETVLTKYIHEKIDKALKQHFETIHLAPDIRELIWADINKRIKERISI